VGADLVGDGLASLPVSPGGQDMPAAPAVLGGDGLPYPLVALVTSTLRPVNVASGIFCSWHLLLLACMRRRSG
jgi:hypothetical protein